MQAIGYLIFWALVVGTCYLINRLRGTAGINPGWVGLVVFVLVLLFEVGAGLVLASRRGQSEFEVGQRIGTAIAASFVPIVASLVLGIRFRKQQRVSIAPTA